MVHSLTVVELAFLAFSSDLSICNYYVAGNETAPSSRRSPLPRVIQIIRVKFYYSVPCMPLDMTQDRDIKAILHEFEPMQM